MCYQKHPLPPTTPRTTETHWRRSCLGSKSPSGHGSPWMVLFLAVHLFTSWFPLTEAQDGGGDATTGPPDSIAPNNKVPPPLLTIKKAMTLPLVASTQIPGTPSGSPDVSTPDRAGYPYPREIPVGAIAIAMQPKDPWVRGDLTLYPRGKGMKGINTCIWFRGDEKKSVPVLTYVLSPVSEITNGAAHTGRESVRKDCVLYIINLVINDTAIYTIKTFGEETNGEGRINVKVIERSKCEKTRWSQYCGHCRPGCCSRWWDFDHWRHDILRHAADQKSYSKSKA